MPLAASNTVAIHVPTNLRFAVAVENWVPYTDGISIGLPAGALPPPGWYFQNTTFYGDLRGHDNNGDYNGYNVNAVVNVPVLVWSPDIKLLGAQYTIALAQPADFVAQTGGPNNASSQGIS